MPCGLKQKSPSRERARARASAVILSILVEYRWQDIRITSQTSLKFHGMSVADSRWRPPPIIRPERGRGGEEEDRRGRENTRAYTQVSLEKQMEFKTGHGPSSLLAKVLFPSRARTRALDPRPSLCSSDQTVPLIEFSNRREVYFSLVFRSLM